MPAHFPPAPSRYPKRCGKAVVGQCEILTTPSRYPLRSAKEATSHDSTLTPAKKILAGKTDSLSPTAVHIPNLDNLNSELPFQTQVLEFNANYSFQNIFEILFGSRRCFDS